MFFVAIFFVFVVVTRRALCPPIASTFAILSAASFRTPASYISLPLFNACPFFCASLHAHASTWLFSIVRSLPPSDCAGGPRFSLNHSPICVFAALAPPVVFVVIGCQNPCCSEACGGLPFLGSPLALLHFPHLSAYRSCLVWSAITPLCKLPLHLCFTFILPAALLRLLGALLPCLAPVWLISVCLGLFCRLGALCLEVIRT